MQNFCEEKFRPWKRLQIYIPEYMRLMRETSLTTFDTFPCNRGSFEQKIRDKLSKEQFYKTSTLRQRCDGVVMQTNIHKGTKITKDYRKKMRWPRTFPHKTLFQELFTYFSANSKSHQIWPFLIPMPYLGTHFFKHYSILTLYFETNRTIRLKNNFFVNQKLINYIFLFRVRTIKLFHLTIYPGT